MESFDSLSFGNPTENAHLLLRSIRDRLPSLAGDITEDAVKEARQAVADDMRSLLAEAAASKNAAVLKEAQELEAQVAEALGAGA